MFTCMYIYLCVSACIYIHVYTCRAFITQSMRTQIPDQVAEAYNG